MSGPYWNPDRMCYDINHSPTYDLCKDCSIKKENKLLRDTIQSYLNRINDTATWLQIKEKMEEVLNEQADNDCGEG